MVSSKVSLLGRMGREEEKEEMEKEKAIPEAYLP